MSRHPDNGKLEYNYCQDQGRNRRHTFQRFRFDAVSHSYLAPKSSAIREEQIISVASLR